MSEQDSLSLQTTHTCSQLSVSRCRVALGFLHVGSPCTLSSWLIGNVVWSSLFQLEFSFSVPTFVSGDRMSSPIHWLLILICHKAFISELFQRVTISISKTITSKQCVSSINICSIFFKTLKWIQVLPNLKPSPDAWKILVIPVPIFDSVICILCKDFGFQVNNVHGHFIRWQTKRQVKKWSCSWLFFSIHRVVQIQMILGYDFGGATKNVQKQEAPSIPETQQLLCKRQLLKKRKLGNCDRLRSVLS